MRTVSENAVSPVVGVMLMLVVVIIIAAIVSGFAGGLAQGNKQAPQATIEGVLHVGSGSNVVVLTHTGGDELVPAKTQIVIKKGDGWGSYTDILEGGYSVIANSAIYDSNKKYWMNATSGGTEALGWRPGEVMYVTYSGVSTSDIGKTLDLEINTVDGKLISKSRMPIVP